MYRLSKSSLLLVAAIVIFVIIFRLIPHPANFAPVGALAMLSGFVLPRKYAIWLPLTAMAISDLIIGTHNLMLWTWGSFALLTLLSNHYARRRTVGSGTVVAGAIAGGLMFYVVTNLGVWLQSGMYSLTFEGLVLCYYNALPFLRNTLLGDLFFATAFYAAYIALKDVNIANYLPLSSAKSTEPRA
jgi:hypothetical protein